MIGIFNISNYAYNFYAVPVFLSGLFIFILGLIIIKKNPSGLRNRAFFILSIIFATWLISESFAYSVKQGNLEVALFWGKNLSWGASLFIPVFTYLLAILWHKEQYEKRKNLFFFFLVITAASFLINFFSNLFIKGVVYHFYGYYPYYTQLGAAYFIFWTIPSLLSIYEIAYAVKQEKSPVLKGNIRIIFISYLISYISSIDHLPIFLPQLPMLYPIGYISMFFYSSFLFLQVLESNLNNM
ncbi:MAG: hypothetical protein V1660_03495 [archaeon]